MREVHGLNNFFGPAVRYGNLFNGFHSIKMRQISYVSLSYYILFNMMLFYCFLNEMPLTGIIVESRPE